MDLGKPKARRKRAWPLYRLHRLRYSEFPKNYWLSFLSYVKKLKNTDWHRNMLNIKLFTTLGCHLCEQAQALLDEYQLASKVQLQIEHVEIAVDATLVELYGIRIPVLKHGDNGSELDWPFDQKTLKVFLQNQG